MSERLLDVIGEDVFGKDNYFRNVQYFDENHIIGEIDIYGIKNDVMYLIEFKSRDTKKAREKAMRQLKKHKKYVPLEDLAYFLVYAYPHADSYNFEIIEADFNYSTASKPQL